MRQAGDQSITPLPEALGAVPDDARILVALYDALVAAHDAILGVANQPRAHMAEDALEAEMNTLLARSTAVARRLAAMVTIPPFFKEQRARVLVDDCFRSGGNVMDATAVLATAATTNTKPLN